MSNRQRSGMQRPLLCHLITIPEHVCVCVYSSLTLSEYVCMLPTSHCCGEMLCLHIANTQSDGHVSNEEHGIKVKGATALHLEQGEKRKGGGVGEVGGEGW